MTPKITEMVPYVVRAPFWKRAKTIAVACGLLLLVVVVATLAPHVVKATKSYYYQYQIEQLRQERETLDAQKQKADTELQETKDKLQKLGLPDVAQAFATTAVAADQALPAIAPSEPFPSMQCTECVARKWAEWGNTSIQDIDRNQRRVRDAGQFLSFAPELGLETGTVPRVRAIAVFKPSKAQPVGHVAIVTAVHGSTWDAWECNWPYPAFALKEHTGTYRNDAPEGYLYFPTPPGVTHTEEQKVALKQYLASKDAPFKDVDVYGYCDAAGITDEQCHLLLAVTGAESRFGTDFRKRVNGVNVVAVEEGLTMHNYGGVKPATKYTPSWTDPWDDTYDSAATGWYLVQFPDDETFWRQFTVGMKQSWFDKGGDKPEDLCLQYVGAPKVCEQTWLERTHFFLNELPT